ncbi:hypothetical protein [Polaromonas sp.]|nr:hypothetical protein [Polaromonas sp.]
MKAKNFEQQFDQGVDLCIVGFIQSQARFARAKARECRFSNVDD